MFNFIKKLLNRNEPETAVERAKLFAEKHGLLFQEFNGGHHYRVKDPATKKFVDFWPSTGKLKQVNGEYSWVGYKARRLQIDLDILIGKYPKKRK